MIAYLMGIHLTANPLRILAAMAVVVLGSAFFACLSMTLAGLVRNRDRLMGIGQAITMPLFFASNALYPVDVMPQWLRWLSAVNPLSYEVNALRALLLGHAGQQAGSTSASCWWPRSSVSPPPRRCCAGWSASAATSARDRSYTVTLAHLRRVKVAATQSSMSACQGRPTPARGPCCAT